ncbi:MAG: glycosyltransferase [Chloroflexi bacterium]|nr:glycosyltransferase [Chloroflexota bacterium]
MGRNQIGHASGSYDEAYYRHYSHDADSPYSRKQAEWVGFFGEMARCIVRDLQPQSVLDAGCALGMLVEALRKLGVDAWGVDVSTYAIGQVPQDVRQFCSVASVTDDLNRDYDLVTCIEVLEHLRPHDADQAVANFASHTHTVLLSSTPDDYQEPTHLNVQPPEYWVGMFARHGFYRDLAFDAYYVSQHAMLFRKQVGLPLDALCAYERRTVSLTAELRELRARYQAEVEAHRSAETDLEHFQTERKLLSGEAAHWEWRTWQANADIRVLRERLDRRHTTDGVPRSILSVGRELLRQVSGRAARTSATSSQPGHPFGLPSSGQKRILFVSDGSAGSRRYRCEHQAEALRLTGWDADVITYEDTFGFLTPQLAAYDGFILQRLPLRPNLEVFIQDAHQQAKPVLYDIDDLIFDPEKAFFWAPFGSMSEHDCWSAKHGMWRNRQTMLLCDAIIVPTEPLRRLAQAVFKDVHVVPNAASQAMLANSERALAERSSGRAGKPVTLGYMSGTPTHERDFGHIADAVAATLQQYPTARLLLVGPLQLPHQLNALADRIQRLPLQPWNDLPGVLSSVSINLAPLEPDNPFTESKSCIKWLEAALVEVPTIASPRGDFVRVIRQGENGLLADSTAAWQASLARLMENAASRQRMGSQARQDVLRSHTAVACGDALQRVILSSLQIKAPMVG